MAAVDCKITRKFLTLCVMLICLDETVINIKVASGLQVEPTWPRLESLSYFSSLCSIYQEEGTNGTFIFQASSDNTCSVRTTAGTSSRTTLMIDDFSESDESLLLYVERHGDIESSHCTNRYVLIDRQALNCSITFDDTNLQITFAVI